MALVGLTFAVAFAAFWTLYFRYPSLQDTDSYYHLAMAREIARGGVADTLPWARMTAMHEAFGDPVLLFHAALAPFASGEHPERRVLLALAGFDAALFAALAALGIAAIGRWGALLPWVVYLGSTEALSRLTRLRPELLALLLLLAAAWFAGRGAYRRLGLVAALYALSYSAIHAFAGLMFAAFLLSRGAEAADRAPLLDGVDGSGHCRSTPSAGSDWVSSSTRAFPPTSPDLWTRRASAWAERRSPVQAPSWDRIRSRSLSSLSSGAWWRLSWSGWRDDRPASARRMTLPETCTTSLPAT